MPIWIRIKEQSRMSEPRKKEGRKKETEADQYSHFLSKQDKGGSEKDNNLQSSYFYNDISS